MTKDEDRLSAEEHKGELDEIFEENIASKPSNEKPRAVILAGQPGSGKGFLARSVKEEFLHQNREAVVINPDDLREFHHRYNAHVKSDPYSAASKVHYDSSLWAEELRDEAIKNKKDLLVDGTLSNPEKADNLVNQLKSKGYEIEVRALAVQKEKSELGIYKRFEDDYSDPEKLERWTPEEIHDQAYEGTPKSLDTVEKNHPDVRISVHSRGKMVLYDNVASDGKNEYASAKVALEDERTRPFEKEEITDLRKSWHSVKNKAKARNAEKEYLRKIDEKIEKTKGLKPVKEKQSSMEIS